MKVVNHRHGRMTCIWVRLPGFTYNVMYTHRIWWKEQKEVFHFYRTWRGAYATRNYATLSNSRRSPAGPRQDCSVRYDVPACIRVLKTLLLQLLQGAVQLLHGYIVWNMEVGSLLSLLRLLSTGYSAYRYVYIAFLFCSLSKSHQTPRQYIGLFLQEKKNFFQIFFTFFFSIFSLFFACRPENFLVFIGSLYKLGRFFFFRALPKQDSRTFFWFLFNFFQNFFFSSS